MISSFILHPSSFIPHPSSFILALLLLLQFQLPKYIHDYPPSVELGDVQIINLKSKGLRESQALLLLPLINVC